MIPTAAWSSPAGNLLQYIPQPNVGTNIFSTSASNETLRDDKGAYRLDYNSHWGLFTAYYFLDDYTLNNPYPVAQSGASVPGFNALYLGRSQLFGLGATKTFGSNAVNEFHFSYMRDNNDLGKPVGGLGVSLASQGFVTGAGTPGIVPLDPLREGVENIIFNSYSIGTNANELKQVNNTFQWIDNLSKVVGRHTIKVGAEFHYDQINTNPIAQFNGSFLFTGSETGSDFADFLLGVPSQYNQSQLQPFYGRNKYLGLYSQDSWRVRSEFDGELRPASVEIELSLGMKLIMVSRLLNPASSRLCFPVRPRAFSILAIQECPELCAPSRGAWTSLHAWDWPTPRT